MEEKNKKKLSYIAESTVVKLVGEAKKIGLTKDNIVSIFRGEGQYFLIYEI